MPQLISRRHFLAMAGVTGGATVLGGRSLDHPATTPRMVRATGGVADVAGRVLVVVELSGGNDGLSMAPPLGSRPLRALRPTVAREDGELLVAGGGVGLHPALATLHERGVATVHGIGSTVPDGSHFEMLRRWWAGDPDGAADVATGFLGRLCDVLDEGAPVTGVSIGGGSSPALLSATAGTIGLPDPGWLWWLDSEDDEWARAYQDGLAAMAQPDATDGDTLARARAGLAGGLDVGDLIADVPDESAYPSSELGSKLALARHLIGADLGVRVVHLTMGGDFDTHEGHRDRHDALMTELDQGLGHFLGDLERAGLADRVLVATTSEFGRRPEENDSAGLDHGSASAALLAGPVRAGPVGDLPSLTNLDDDGNLVATATFDRYYATLAEGWFEIPADQVLAGRAAPFDVW